MTRQLTAHSLLVTLGFLASASSVIIAHHGTSGVYDYTQRITTKATVTKYVWANPHVQIHFTLKNDKGEDQTWGVETVSPGNALGNGWTKDTFKAGDQLLVSFIPAKGDRFFGNCPQIVFVADGKRLGGNGRCGQGAEAVDANTLPVKQGYTAVEVKMPKDDRKRPDSEQEK
jgi:Family of unknown function (DUF6152)